MADFTTIDTVVESYRQIIGDVEAIALRQGLWTHDAPPILGQQRVPTHLGRKPTDVTYRWTDFLPNNLPTAWRFAAKIDIYTGPQGSGYIFRAAVIDGGVRMERAIDEGPEGRSHDWRAVEA